MDVATPAWIATDAGPGVPTSPSTGRASNTNAPVGRVTCAVPSGRVVNRATSAPPSSWITTTAPDTGRASHAGSPGRTTGQVGPARAVTVTLGGPTGSTGGTALHAA